MANPDHRNGGGTNSRPLEDTIAETGPGLPDEAVGPGQMDENDIADMAAEADRRGARPPDQAFKGTGRGRS